MSENSSSGNDPALNCHEDEVNGESKARILTQEDVNEQIRSCIAPQTKQLDGLTRLIQGMPSAQQTNIYSRAGTSASFSAASHPPDNKPSDAAQSISLSWYLSFVESPAERGNFLHFLLKLRELCESILLLNRIALMDLAFCNRRLFQRILIKIRQE